MMLFQHTLVLEKNRTYYYFLYLTKEEKLESSGAKTPYYWRVLAVDQAGNVGAWSTANTFSIASSGRAGWYMYGTAWAS
jgi:hypothetical protein